MLYYLYTNTKGVVTMEDDFNEYGQYEDDYQTFEDNCAWEDARSDMESWDGDESDTDYEDAED